VKIGKLTLNRVPDNFFQFTEQSAFAPGLVVPGIEPSEDKMLQGRLFSYPDTQRYRVGPNYLMLPVNAPKSGVSNVNQDGFMNFSETKGDVNYEPSVTSGGRRDTADAEYSKAALSGTVVQQPIEKQQNFKQAGDLYKSFTDAEKTNLIKNLAGDLNKVKNAEVKKKMVAHFYAADADYGTRLAKAVGVQLSDVEATAKTLAAK